MQLLRLGTTTLLVATALLSGVNSQTTTAATPAPAPATTTTPTSTSPAAATTSGAAANVTTPVNVTTLFPGRLTITQPQMINQQALLFKVGSSIPIQWTFDNNTQAKPLNMTFALLLTSNTLNPVAILGNATGAPTQFVWNTSTWDSQANGPLLLSTPYTFGIWDQRGKNSGTTPGYLMPSLDLKFTMYESDDSFCAACSGASSLAISGSMVALSAMTAIRALY